MTSTFLRRAIALPAVLAVASSLSLTAVAQTGTTTVSGPASVLFEQDAFMGHYGNWTLHKPDQSITKLSAKTYTLSDAPPGLYTLFVEPPEGGAATIEHYKGDALFATVERPQVSFTVAAGDNFRFKVSYKLAKFGNVSVTSTPAGIPYRLRGPNDFEEFAKTPGNYPRSPIGLYSVEYLPEGCPKPPARSQHLVNDGRVTFHIELICSTLITGDEEEQEEQEDFVPITVDGETIVFSDVPQSAWFAPYVFAVAKVGIVTGYTDDRGQPTGRFGPENPVTIAELAKIAHRVAGIDETEVSRQPDNLLARGEWVAPFIASAEQRDWVLYTDPSLDLNRPALRGEILITLLQAFNVPLEWPTGALFTDVTGRTPYAAAIETAANDGIVSGFTDDHGVALGTFGPSAPVNRAEVAKIINAAMDTYRHEAE
ncbi:MAG: S-layer homology domain-containing protein [Candidatus Peregrinibacteria bacterium]|nr:S-layer homology domain-containing protein [Candidatus Peregrinibacteria bacterium]